MTLNQLRYFCTASRCHSITKAAEELYGVILCGQGPELAVDEEATRARRSE